MPADDEGQAQHAPQRAPRPAPRPAEAVGVHGRQKDAAEEVVEGAEEDESAQAGNASDDAQGAPDIDGPGRGLFVGGHRCAAGQTNEHEVCEDSRRHGYGDGEHPAHPERADDEAAEDRGEEEGDAIRGTDEAVRFIADVFGHEVGHEGEHGDGAEVARYRAKQCEDDEDPERDARCVGEFAFGGGDEERPGEPIEDERNDAGGREHELLIEAVYQ